jgi:hypothetical protein
LRPSKELTFSLPLEIPYIYKKTLSEMLGWIRIYGHPCAGPAGTARALAGNRKSKKRKENIWIQALKTKTIRTALKFLKTQKSSTLESPKYWQSYIFGWKLLI